MLGKITDEECLNYLPQIMKNATKLGFTSQLYESYTNYEELVIGNYIRLLELSYENQLINEEKLAELLLNRANPYLIKKHGIKNHHKQKKNN